MIDSVKQNDALSQLGGLGGGGDLLQGLLPVVMGLVNGTAGKGASTSTQSQVNTQKREQQFFQQITSDVNSQDNRIPSILQGLGEAAGGEETGEDWKTAFKELPDFLKNMLQTAFNGSTLGQLTGGDPQSMTGATVNMLRGSNEFTNPGGLNFGGQFSPQRRAMAGEVNGQLLDHFQDSNGVPRFDRTQGQSFENISKFTQSMSEDGGFNPQDLIKGMDSSGGLEIDDSAMSAAKGNITKGMELFRNLSDVFGSNDFSELMNQAERLGGLNMSDPSSIGKTLTSIRNARGVANAVGVDERKALGDLALANDTMVGMGVDRRTAASMNLNTFAGIQMQGQRNLQDRNPFEQDIHRKRLGASELMQQQSIANTALLSEAENRPMGEVSMTQQLRMFMAKPRNMSEGLQNQITEALDSEDPVVRKKLAAKAIGAIKEETGIDTVAQAKQLSLGKLRELQDQGTLDLMADDTQQVLLGRNKRRFRENFMDQEFNSGMIGSKLGNSFKNEENRAGNDQVKNDQIDKERDKTFKDLREFESLMVNSTEVGGLQKLSEMASIAEGKDGNVRFFDEEQNKNVTMNAKDMDKETRREAIVQQLEAIGVDSKDAQGTADTLMKTPELMDTIRSKTGMSINDASFTMGNLGELVGTDDSMIGFSLSKQARESGQLAMAEGANKLKGGPAMTDPLQNLILGAMGTNEKAQRDKAFTDAGLETQTLSGQNLALTNQQKELFSDLGDNQNLEERKKISGKENTNRAMVDMAARILPELEKAEIGGESLAEKILLKEDIATNSEDAGKMLETFQKDMNEVRKLERAGKTEEAADIRAKNFGVFSAIANNLGGEGQQSRFGIMDIIEDGGENAVRTKKIEAKEVTNQIKEIEKNTSLKELEKMTEKRNQLREVEKLETQEKEVEELRKSINVGDMDKARELRAEAEVTFSEEDADILKDPQGSKEVQEARSQVEKFSSEKFQKRYDEIHGVGAADKKLKQFEAITEEYNQRRQLARENEEKQKQMFNDADELERPQKEIEKQEEKLDTQRKLVESKQIDKETIQDELRESMRSIVMDESEEDVSQEQKQALIDFIETEAKEGGETLTAEEVQKKLRKKLSTVNKSLEEQVTEEGDMTAHDKAMQRIGEMQESGELTEEEALDLANDVFNKEDETARDSDVKHSQVIEDQLRAKDKGITVKELRAQRAQRLEDAGIDMEFEETDEEKKKRIEETDKKKAELLQEKERITGLLETSSEVFDEDEKTEIAELERRGEGDLQIEIAEGGGKDIQNRINFQKSEEFKKAKKTKKLIDSLGIQDDAEDMLETIAGGSEIGKEKTTLQEEIVELEEQIESGNPVFGQDVSEIQNQIDEKKKKIEKLESFEGVGDFSERVFEQDLMGTKGDKENDLISRLAGGGEEETGGILDAFANSGINKLEVSDQLAAAEKTLQQELTKAPEAERGDIQKRLEEVQEAHSNVKGQMGDSEVSSLLIDLIDRLNRVMNDGMKVTMQ
jgi:hypothetical protein